MIVQSLLATMLAVGSLSAISGTLLGVVLGFTLVVKFKGGKS